MSFPAPVVVPTLDAAKVQNTQWDAVVFISDSASCNASTEITDAIEHYTQFDQRVGKEALMLHASGLAGQRLVFAPTGALNRDYDDVRRVADAAKAATKILLGVGATAPLVVVELSDRSDTYARALEVAYLAVCQEAWQPLEAREALIEDDIEPLKQVGLFATEVNPDFLRGLEAGRRVARDLCGTEPERMAPPGFADYCQQTFTGSAVKVSVIDDDKTILAEYPLLHAVARASVEVPRHQARVIRLEYTGSGDIKQTLFLAGKGITYDTGGVDLKVGGHMAGMSRDKGGAAGVAGIMKVLAETQPPGINVIAEIGAVRNSIGANAFVPDEIITGHAGKRVRVGNTDAEGRMVLADLLSHLRQEAQQAVNPQVFSLATLTGHAALSFGPYTALVENGPAKAINTAADIATAGELWGDPAEQSLSRREDFDFVKGRTKADDLISSNNAPSVATARGHQFPMAFLSIASGLDQHCGDSDQPIPYTHVDIAGSGVENGDWQHGKPTAAPVVAFAAHFLASHYAS